MQDCSNSSALTMELLQFCAKQSNCECGIRAKFHNENMTIWELPKRILSHVKQSDATDGFATQ